MAEHQDPLIVAPSDGVVRGDSKPFRNRGTRAGFTGVGNDSYGADVSQSANNRRGSAHTAPDPADMCCPPGGGDFRAGSNRAPSYGRKLGSAAGSDDPSEVTPGDEGMAGDRD